MADQLYLSLWFPNFRFDTLPATLVSVMRQFALISGDKRVAAASVYPISFTEAPTYQRIYDTDERTEEPSSSLTGKALTRGPAQIRDDFVLDTPWLAETLEDKELDEDATKHIQQNVEMLLAFTLSVEKNCGISSRLLWTESGEPLAQKLIDRLQRVN